MLMLITKASSDYWYDFIEEDSIENLIGRFAHSGHLSHDLIIKEQASKIAECKYEIQIYDSWIE